MTDPVALLRSCLALVEPVRTFPEGQGRSLSYSFDSRYVKNMANVLIDFNHDLGHCDHGLWAPLQPFDEDKFSDCAVIEQTYTEADDAALDFSDDEPCSSTKAFTPSKPIAHSEEIINEDPQEQTREEYRTTAWFVV